MIFYLQCTNDKKDVKTRDVDPIRGHCPINAKNILSLSYIYMGAAISNEHSSSEL